MPFMVIIPSLRDIVIGSIKQISRREVLDMGVAEADIPLAAMALPVVPHVLPVGWVPCRGAGAITSLDLTDKSA